MNPTKPNDIPTTSTQGTQPISSLSTTTLDKNNPQKPDIYKDLAGKKAALTFLIIAIVSFFILPFMSIGAISLAGLGIWSNVKQKSGLRIISINILTILLGLASNVLNLYVKSHLQK